MTYKFKYKRSIFWHSIDVVGHSYTAEQNKCILYLENGGIREISDWKSCELSLGFDWVIAVKKHMESQTGTPIAVNR
jgi:hypothetical protein